MRKCRSRNHLHAEGVIAGPEHQHYAIDPRTGDHEVIANPMCWGSCSMTDEELATWLDTGRR